MNTTARCQRISELEAQILTPEEAATVLWELEGGIHGLFTEDQWEVLVANVSERGQLNKRVDI